MKSKTLLNLIGIFLFGLITLSSCSNNDDSSPDNTDSSPDNTVIASILDKWWYASICCTTDIYIHSDGQYEQRDSESNEITYTGNWVWEDEKLPIIKVDYDEGTDQHLSTVWLKFFDIQEHTMSIWQSEEGTDFYPVSTYQDTDI